MASSIRLRNKTRFSSPATPAKEPEPAADIAARARANQGSEWVEPPPRAPIPSFEEFGLDRGGVLEYMLPLGQAPTNKYLQKLKLAPPRTQYRATATQDEEEDPPTNGDEGTETASPAEQLVDSEEVFKPEEATMRRGSLQSREQRDEDEEHPPAETVAPTPPPEPKSVSASVPDSLPSSSVPPSTRHHEQLSPERIQVHVEGAIQEAARTNSPALIPGLRKLRDDAASEPALWGVIDAVLHKTHTRKQLRIFRRYIKTGVATYSSPLKSINEARPAFETYQDRIDSSSSKTKSASPAVATLSHKAVPPLQPTPFFTSLPSITPGPPSPMISSSVSPAAAAATITVTAPTTGVKTRSESANGFNGKGYVEPMQTRSASRKRSGSASSSSSLSSAKSLDAETFAPTIEVEPETQVNGAKITRSQPRQATSRIAAGHKNRSAPPQDPFFTFKTSTKIVRRRNTQKEDPEFDQEEINQQRLRYQEQSFHEYELEADESKVREEDVAESMRKLARSHTTITIPPPVVHPHHVHPSEATLSSPVEVLAPPENSLRNGTSRKRSRNELETDEGEVQTPASSSPGPLLAPPPPGAANSSRSGTPRYTRLPLAKKARKSARVMVSPNKPKNGGITAGFSRPGPGKEFAIGTGADSSEEENNDYCGACGGNGELLCCDGCPNSFHFSCLDPPVDPKEPPDGEWYCARCIARRNRGPAQTNGILGRLVRHVDDINPKAYSLPLDIREYFEGVKTGDEGEYGEFGQPRTQTNAVKMNRAGFIEEPNYKELRDSKGNFVTCYHCYLPSNGRDIIPCDFCPARWHLDCLDPPLAVPPRRKIGDKPNATWRCPLHVEHDLAQMDQSDGTSTPGELGRVPRLRKPRNALPFDVSMGRGFKNNGLIDVQMMKEDQPDIREVEMMGTVYRLPEKGIRLDFIDRVKRSWYEDQTFPRYFRAPKRIRTRVYRPTMENISTKYIMTPQPKIAQLSHDSMDTDIEHIDPTPEASANADANATRALRAKSFPEQQAVLHLRDLALSGGYALNDAPSASGIEELTNRLIADAPPAVAEAVQGEERAALLQLQDLIRRRLDVIAPAVRLTNGDGDGNGNGTLNGQGSEENDMDDSMDAIS